MKEISVIVPVYNAERQIEKCLRSIRNQKNVEIEILCVDDGSTDDSAEMIRRMKQVDGRIRLLPQKNQGAAAARNYALREAEGQYVAFADADDFFLDETALEQMYRTAQRENAGICGAFRCMEQNGRITAMDLHREGTERFPSGRKIYYRDYQYDYHFQNYIYKRTMLIENDIFFPDYRRFQDPPFFVKAMIAAEVFFVVPVEYYCYHFEHETYAFGGHKVNDIVKGLTDILKMSMDAGLKKLHVTAVMRLNESYFWDIAENCVADNPELLLLLTRANESICWEWVDEKICKQRLIKPLQWLLWSAEANNNIFKQCFENKHRYGYSVPLHRLASGGRIVLYAAGNVGQAYYRQLQNVSEFEIVLWVDYNWKKFEAIPGMNVRSPETILDTEYDYVLIALDDYNRAKEAADFLREMGVEEKKLIWGI